MIIFSCLISSYLRKLVANQFIVLNCNAINCRVRRIFCLTFSTSTIEDDEQKTAAKDDKFSTPTKSGYTSFRGLLVTPTKYDEVFLTPTKETDFDNGTFQMSTPTMSFSEGTRNVNFLPSPENRSHVESPKR